MKSFLYTFLIISLPAYPHSGEDHSNDKPIEESKFAVDYTPVKAILEKSCFNCHSKQVETAGFYTKLPLLSLFFSERKKEALTHIDFTQGYPPIGHGSQKSDLVAIHKSLVNNNMPPSLWNWWHEESRLNEQDRRFVIEWIETTLNGLE